MLEHVKVSCRQNTRISSVFCILKRNIFDEAAKPPNHDCFDSRLIGISQVNSRCQAFNGEQLTVQYLVGGIQTCLAAAALFLPSLGRSF